MFAEETLGVHRISRDLQIQSSSTKSIFSETCCSEREARLEVKNRKNVYANEVRERGAVEVGGAVVELCDRH
jgi:hypothetical protein